MSLRRGCSPIATQEEEERKVEDEVVLCLRCSSSIATTRDLWSNLPEDIKVEILCRLKFKRLIRFKFVSKDWNFLISNVCLRRLSPPSPSATFCGLLLFEEPPEDEESNSDTEKKKLKRKLNLHFLAIGEYLSRVYARQVIHGRPKLGNNILALLPPDHDPSDIQDCCNGLLLLASDRQSPTRYYVCNPATKQCVDIPVNPNHHQVDYYSSLVFDPLIYNYYNNYGCNYTIVRCIRRPLPPAAAAVELELDIFSSETGEWISHVAVVPLEHHPHNLLMYGSMIKQSVYWNGILYYLSFASYLVCININILLRVGADDYASNGGVGTCWAVELPDKQQHQDTAKATNQEQQERGQCGCIGISSGCLYYSNRHSERRSNLLVWMLVVGNGFRSQWVLRQIINTDEIVGVIPGAKLIENARELFWPCAFHPTDDEIIYMAASRPQILASYHLRTKRACLTRHPWYFKRTVLDQKLIFPYSRCLVALGQL